ncbi:MAG TPA: hypothetical protein VGH11_02680 [Jatrophihabitans sp.]|jgi:hypothetical protein
MTTTDPAAVSPASGQSRSRRHARRADYRVHAGAATGVIAILAVGGYTAHWKWTGFSGNTLWDWLHLLILPVVLAVLPHLLRTPDPLSRRTKLLLFASGVAFAALVIGGYTFDWKWTGFRGNTLWDWMELLLVPFVLPIVLFQLTRAEDSRRDSN